MCILLFSFRYHEFVTIKRVCVVLAFVWFYSLIAGALLVLVNRDAILKAHFIVLSVASLMDIYFLLKIYKTAHRHSTQIQAQQQSTQPNSNTSQMKKSLKAMYLIIAAFVLCYLPYVICSGVMAAASRLSEVLMISYRITEGLILLNSCINPMIYYWRIEEFRNATRIVLNMN